MKLISMCANVWQYAVVLMPYIACCALVILRLGKNIFTFIWWFVNLYLLLGIVKR